MVQSSLVELARNGNPQAIASLMNLVLEPKGVVARTQLEGNCLHVVFTSEHLLSQAAIANFVKHGLITLGPKSFHTVKLYAQKSGQNQPLWVDSFSLGSAVAAPTVPPSPPPAPAPSSPPRRAAVALPRVNSVPVGSASVAAMPVSPAPVSASAKPRKPAPPRAKGVSHGLARSLHSTVLNNPYLNSPYKIAIAVSISAFLIGGTAAILSGLSASSSTQTTAANPASSPAAGAIASNSMQSLSQQSLSQRPPDQTAPTAAGQTPFTTARSLPSDGNPEHEVETYLIQMNKAQQAFQQANGRFAATLEELERSASVMSQSTNYTYRLVLRDQNQSVITAIPKHEGLRSYSGTVIAGAASGIICKTNQPSTFPPILAQANDAATAPAQCPVDSSPVLN